MVAIYNNHKVIAVSNSKEEAIIALYNKYHKEGIDSDDPMKWWEQGKRWNCGAPRCHEIEEIAVW